MTWGVHITDKDGNRAANLGDKCQECAHNGACNINKVAWPLGNVLTSVDVGSDGHMASGDAELRCDGFEPEVGPEAA